MQKSIERFFIDGCLRCELGATEHCKVVPKRTLLLELRELIKQTELEETMKWGNPCYTLQNKNVLMFSALKDCAVLSFFKGALLKEEENSLLEKQGENSHHARIIRLYSSEELNLYSDKILDLIKQAIELERTGQKIDSTQFETAIPEELSQKLNIDEELKNAFDALTPGRKRSYYLYIGQAKQSATRIKRIEQCRSKIFLGKGWNEY